MSPLYHSVQHLPYASGIYKITCKVDRRLYIGSGGDIRKRCSRHLTDLRKNRHCNQKLQRAFNKHGESAFTFDVVEIVLIPELLTAREQYYLDTLKPFDKKGFNICHTAGSCLGRSMSPEACAKVSKARKGKPNPHPGNNFSVRNRPLSPEHRAKIAASNRGKHGHRLGKKASPETIARISAANKGRKPPPEEIERNRLAHLGKKPSANAIIAVTGNEYKAKDYIVTDPNGIEYVVHNMAKFCRENQLNKVNLGKVALGQRNHHRGWKARFADEDTEAS